MRDTEVEDKLNPQHQVTFKRSDILLISDLK